MVNMIETTEQKILEAAKKIFHQKGFDGARMQEIADEAGINKALVHYYYRSKDNLFEAVFEDALSQLVGKLGEIFYSELTLQSKIEIFLNYYLTFLSQNSYLPMFILNSLYNKPEHFKALLEKKLFSPNRLILQIKQQLKEEMNLDIDPLLMYINILSVCVFPVIARPLIQNIFAYSPEEMEVFYEQRKKLVSEFIINALKGYKNEATETKTAV